MNMGGITVGYSGVHQAYQLALAAHELGELDRFYCSLFDAPGKWGRRLAHAFGPEALTSRRIAGLPAARVLEHPWPLLRHQLHRKLFPARAEDWCVTNDRFDAWVATRLERSRSRVFVGTETCAAQSFLAARERGITRVLDCPQMHPDFLLQVLAEGTRRMGWKPPTQIDSEPMARRKTQEFALAEWFLVYSAAHRRSFEAAGIATERIIQAPLWVNPTLWFPEPRLPKPPGSLRVIFTGAVSLRKGVFFLLAALPACPAQIELTIAGPLGAEGEEILRGADARAAVRVLGPQSRPQLRQLYAQHDVLVLPSLADTFGFVALEAMACGLPVIVTENCGVPVPDESWRVPVMDSAALARRLEHYATDPAALEMDGALALRFSRQFTPERYREQIQGLFRRLLPKQSL